MIIITPITVTRVCQQFKFSVPLCIKPFSSHTPEPSSNCMRHALPLWVSSIPFYSEWNRGWHLSNTTFLQYRMYKSHIMLFDEWIKFSFEKNCGAALMGKWNSKLWYQTRWKGSNFHPGDKMRQKFCSDQGLTLELSASLSLHGGNLPAFNLVPSEANLMWSSQW